MNSYNLYAYCSNNPARFRDPDGNFIISAIIAGVSLGFAIGFGSSVATQVADAGGDWSKVDFAEATFDGVFGAINGGLAASGVSIGMSIFLGATMGGVSSVGKDLLFEGGNIDWKKAGIATLMGGISGAIAGAGADNVKSGSHITKFINSREVLNRTIANGTKSAISRQTVAMNVHATQLVISGARYLISSVFGIFASQVPVFGR